MRTSLNIFLLAFVAMAFVACQDADKNQTGSEYMPDMAHSIAYEANTYFDYYQNTWENTSVKKKYELVQPGTPVNGTIPRGYAGFYLASVGAEGATVSAQQAAMKEVKGMTDDIQSISTPVNGSVPYYYADSDTERARAIADIQTNPFPITVDGLARGKELYNLFCAICHGEKGDGNGYIYENGAYPAAPANFLQESWVDTSAGLYYHAMMYGKNVMGHYKDKVSYEERWQIIHHIRALQAKEFKMDYNADSNTLTPGEASTIASNAQFARYLESFAGSGDDMNHQNGSSADQHRADKAHGEGHHDMDTHEEDHGSGDHNSDDHSETDHH